MVIKNVEKSDEDFKEKSWVIIKYFKRFSDLDFLYYLKVEKR